MDNYKNLKDTYTRLQEGQIFKNYRSLCEFLNQPVKTGSKNKKYQIEEFNRYFEFDKAGKGHSLIITTVYDEPLAKISKGMYSSLISKLIVDTIVEELDQGNHELLLSNNQLFNMLSMINEKYMYYKNEENHDQLIEILNVKQQDIDHFYSVTSFRFQSMVESALNHLKNELFLFYTKPMVMIINIGGNRTQMQVANEDEIQYITKIRKKVLEEMGYSNINHFRNNKKDKFIYHSKVHEELNGNIEELKNKKSCNYNGIEFAYQVYKIIFIDSIEKKQQQINQYLEDNSIEVRQALNDLIVSNTNSQYEKRYDKSKQEIGIYNNTVLAHLHDYEDWKALHTYNQLKFKAGNTYVNHGSRLIDYTIKTDMEGYKEEKGVLEDKEHKEQTEYQQEINKKIDETLGVLDKLY